MCGVHSHERDCVAAGASGWHTMARTCVVGSRPQRPQQLPATLPAAAGWRPQPARQTAAAATAAARNHIGSPIGGSSARFAIVVARFNELVTRLLLAGAQEAFVRHGVPEENIEVGSSKVAKCVGQLCNAEHLPLLLWCL